MNKTTNYSTMDEKEVSKYVEEIDDLNAFDESGLSPLHHICASNENANVVRNLLRAGANATARTEGGLTPLHAAAAYNSNPNIVSALIECGAGANARSSLGLTPLLGAAAYNKNPKVVSALIDAGCQLGAVSEQKLNALFAAAAHNSNPGMVSLLVKSGIPVDARDSNDATALHFAAAYNSNPEVAGALIDAGAEIDAADSCGLAPLHLAARGNPEPRMVLTLIEGGAKIGLRSDDGKIAMDFAKSSNEAVCKSNAFVLLRSVHKSNWATEEYFSRATPEDVKACLADGVKINAAGGSKSLSPLHWAVRYTRQIEVIEILLENKASLNFSDGIGQTPLHWAVRNTHAAKDIVKLLIAKGANVKSRTRNDDATPLRSAARYAVDAGILDQLISAGADAVDTTSKGNTLLHTAIRNEFCMEEVVKLLMGHGLDINAKDSNGMTPLHHAIRYMRAPEQIAFLIESGADPLAKSGGYQPRTPLELASKSNRKNLAKLFPSNAIGGKKKKKLAKKKSKKNDPSAEQAESKTAEEAGAPEGKVEAADKEAEIAEKKSQATKQAVASDSTEARIWGDADYFSHATPEDVSRNLEIGADIAKPFDSSRRTALHLAASTSKHVEVVGLLIEKGADLNARDSNGMTALHFCGANATAGADIAKLLIDSGADLTSRTKRDGATPLRMAVKNAVSLDVVTAMIDGGASLDDHTKRGVPLLHSAARNRKIAVKVVRDLLARDADIAELDKAGNNILHVAMRVRSPRATIEFLLDAGADPQVKNSRGKKPTDVGPPSLRKALSTMAAAHKEKQPPSDANSAAEEPSSD
ncbi:MAG: ankyrin repeat domain-containing protein [Rhodobacteraceae bacterium]|nr:ankyrin repeat domain-containing protein [Paracoccaceae bacterium]